MSITTYAAIDLGSNSFHMIIAREEDGHVHILDKLRETVRLASGLTSEGDITGATEDLALDTLAQFGQRLREFASSHVRCVGTNTLRKVSANSDFLTRAEATLGHPIEIISGREEARLIYLGTSHSTAPIEGNQLVIDIGGGSTELILGAAGKPHTLESVGMGCVTFTNNFFPNGDIDAERYKKAVTEASLKLQPIVKTYKDHGWQGVLGCSGTIKAVEEISQANGWTKASITYPVITHIRDALIRAGNIDYVELEALSDNRQPVIMGGLAVLDGLFQSLNIKQMDVSQSSLREGLLYDSIGRTRKTDLRKKSVLKMMRQYDVDKTHAKRVKRTAKKLFKQLAHDWQLNDTHKHNLKWAIQLCEVGLSISHSRYHRHSEYIVRHSDMPGFSWSEQSILATLVRLQRSSFNLDVVQELPLNVQSTTQKLAVILRLAVIFNRSRLTEKLPQIRVRAQQNHIDIFVDPDWLNEQALTQAKILSEIDKHKSAQSRFTLCLNPKT